MSPGCGREAPEETEAGGFCRSDVEAVFPMKKRQRDVLILS